jgi:hypothetical protein
MQHLFYEAFNIRLVLYAASRHCLARYARNHSMHFPLPLTGHVFMNALLSLFPMIMP